MHNIFIHPTALVESETIGTGTRIWAMVHILKGATIGTSCNIGDHTFIESGVTVGNNVTIKNGNMLWEGITLEDEVFVGPHVFFTNDRYPRSPRSPAAQQRYQTNEWLIETRVQRGASLGAGAIILPGITIGEYAMVGAGAVVTRNVPAYTLVIGNPAQTRGWVCRCGLPLNFAKDTKAICHSCRLHFRKEGETILLIHNS